MSKTTIPTGGIGADAITAAKIADDAVSEEHLDATAITGSTELAATPADTDEILISDAGTLKRIDFSYIKSLAGTQIVYAERTGGNQTLSDNTWTKVEYNSDNYDPDSNWDTTNDRYIAPSAGRYYFTATAYLWGRLTNVNSAFYLNGSSVADTYHIINFNTSDAVHECSVRSNAIMNLSASDYVELYAKSDVHSGSVTVDQVGTQFLAFRLD
jgi:hypothetical protein